MAQMSYSQKMSYGVAGGLYDLSHHVVDSRTNEADDDVLRFGFGVVEGSVTGVTVALPASDATKAKFEGVVVNSHAHEENYYGDVKIRNNETVGVMKDGRIFVRIAEDVEPKYGDAVYLITDGTYAGYFTNDNADVTAIKLKGYFLGEKANDDIAPVYINADKTAD